MSGLLFLTIIRSSSARSFFNSVELCGGRLLGLCHV